MIIFLRQLASNGLSIIVNSMNILFGLEECAGRIGNPKQYKSHWWAKQND